MLTHLLDFLLLHEASSLTFIFLILVACGLGLPVPEDITLVTSGILVSFQITSFWMAVIVGMAGVLLGDSTVYWIGRLWGSKLLQRPRVAKIFKPNLQDQISRALHRYGNKIIFIARFLPGLRAPIYFFVGSFKRSYWSFLLIDFFAAIISVPVWVYVGEIFGENIPKLEAIVKELKTGSLVFVAFLIFIFFIGGRLKDKLVEKVMKQLR